VITEDKSIASSIEEIEKKPKKKIIEVQRIKEILSKNEPTREEKELQLLLRHIRKLRYELKKAKDENAAMQRKKIDINAETKKIISFKEQRALELERIVNLQKKELDKNKKIIKKLDLFISHISAGSVIIKRLKNLGSEEFESRSEILNITEGDILLVEDMGIVSKKVIDELAGKARIIIYSGNTSKELDSRFLLIPKASLDLHETKYFASVNKECLEEEISKHANAKKVGKDFLKRLIEEYKRERNA
jgi:predicted RNase H-like nuclease (RuvC/YqgF family)